MGFRSLLVAATLLTSAHADASSPSDAAQSLDDVVVDQRIVVLGEFHGSAEIPALVAQLAEILSASRPLIVALEMPAQEQERLSAFMDSEGTVSDRDQLVEGEFWQRPHERSDGRRSVATLALLESLRELRKRGRGIEAYAFDDERFHDGRDRDAAMAAALARRAQDHPSMRFLVLTGNYHARLRRPERATVNGQPYLPPQPMAALLKQEFKSQPMLSVNVAAARGSFWGCRQRCGPIELPIRPVSEAADQLQSDGAVYDYVLTLPELTSSPPVSVPGPSDD